MPERTYNSVHAQNICNFISEMRSAGYKYEEEEVWLSQFDRWWIEEYGDAPELTQERLEGWCMQRPTEGLSHQSCRISVIRQFTRYLCRLGLDCWIPTYSISVPQPHVHILTNEEIKDFFAAVDEFCPSVKNRAFDVRLVHEYKVLFRLYLSTGLRNNEAVCLTLDDVDCDKGTIFVRSAKNRKDRIVYMAPDMAEAVRDYKKWLTDTLGTVPNWLFPGRSVDLHISKCTVCSRFELYWSKTPAAVTCEKKPTPHSLRHTYVVLRMNAWMKEGRDLDAMIPYLARSLGHTSREETFYYFHQVFESMEIVKKYDVTGSSLIPEVMKP